MKNNGMKIKHHKMRGEWAELCFMTRATELGLQVSKPWGDSASYDFVVEHNSRCVRVQVKSTMHRVFGGHACQVRGSQRRAYVDDSFDFVAVYLILEDVWYIIPTQQVSGQVSLFFSTKLKNAKYSLYKEAWHLLRGDHRIPRIEACAEEFGFPEIVEMPEDRHLAFSQCGRPAPHFFSASFSHAGFAVLTHFMTRIKLPIPMFQFRAP